MNIVAKCPRCGKQKVIVKDKCRACTEAVLEILADSDPPEQSDAAEPAQQVRKTKIWVSLTNPDEWYIIADAQGHIVDGLELGSEGISNIGNDIVDEHGPTEKAAEVQGRQNRMMRKILRNIPKTKDLRYLGCKCAEKI